MAGYDAHVVRFVDYQPSGVSCLAFEDLRGQPRLAVSREDGTIELWKKARTSPGYTNQNRWFIECIIPRYEDKVPTKLAWCEKRLFSVGLSGDLIEWDIERLAPKLVTDSQGGSVWSVAVSHSRKMLAIGCEDGAPRLFDLEQLGLHKALDKQESRVVSVAWGPGDLILAAGGVKGTICLYNIKNGRITTRMTCDTEENPDIVIWALMITSDMVVVSSNSIGQTQFWDMNTGTLWQTFNAHQADVTALCMDKAERTVFSSGVDSKIAQFVREKNESGFQEWQLIKKVLGTPYDIRSLAVVPGQDSIVISAGVDPVLVECRFSQVRVKQEGFVRPQRVPCRPFRPICMLAQGAGLLMSNDDRNIHVWKLPNKIDRENIGISAPIKLFEASFEELSSVVSSCISQDGRFIAVALRERLHCYRLDMNSEVSLKRSIRIKKLPVQSLDTGIQLVTFCKEELVVCCGDAVRRMKLGDNNIDLVSTISYDKIGRLALPLVHVCCSQDGNYLAIVDCHGAIHVLNKNLDMQVLKLPVLCCRVTAIAFQPKTNFLMWICSEKHIHAYDLEEDNFLKWSIRACELQILSDILKPNTVYSHLFFSPCNNNIFLLSQTGLVKVVLDIDLPREDSTRFLRKQRKSVSSFFTTEKGEDVVKVVYRNPSGVLLYADFCQNGEFVLVEKTMEDILNKLPPPLQLKKYGF